MRIIKKSALLILLALLINIIFTDVVVYAAQLNNGDTEEIKKGEKVDFNADPGSKGKSSGSGNQNKNNGNQSTKSNQSSSVSKGKNPGSSSIRTNPGSNSKQKTPGSNNNENQSTKTNQSQSTSKGKNPGSSSIQISPGSNSKQKTPGSSNRGSSSNNYGFIVGSGAFGYTPGNGNVFGTVTGGSKVILRQGGHVIGTVTPGGRVMLTDGGSSSSKKQTKTTRSKTTTSTSTTKGNTYTKKIRTERYDWTIENVSDKSIAKVERSTSGPTLTYTFNHTGKYYIEAVPYCYYEQGYDETTTTTTRRDGKVISRKHDTKFVKTKSYYAHDTKNKSTFTVIVTLDDVGEPIKLPPDPGRGDPEGSNEKPVYELVE